MKKTAAMLIGVLASATALSGCSEGRPAKPTDKSCQDYDWDEEEGVWVCDDHSSSHYGYYYHGGRYFSSLGALKNNKEYKSYQKSSSIKSGFGSGSKASGS